MRNPIFCITALSLAAMLSGCLTDGSSSGSSPSGLRRDIGAYSIQDGKIITPAKPDTSYYCNDTTLEFDVYSGGPDTLPFELSGNTLTLLQPNFDTLASGAVIQSLSLANRVGSGSGLEGSWTFSEWSYRVVSGALSADEKSKWDLQQSQRNAESKYSSGWVQFSGGAITTYEDTRTADKFVADWNGLNHSFESPNSQDSANYNISARTLSKYTVELKGRTKAETVQLTINNDRSRVYTSNVAGHGEYHYDYPPKTCPNPMEPDWYLTFLSDNAKNGQGVLPKRSASAKPKFWPYYER